DTDDLLDVAVSPQAESMVGGSASDLADLQPSSATATTVEVIAVATTSSTGQHAAIVTEAMARCDLDSVNSAAAISSATVAGQAPFAVASSSSIPVSYAASTLLPAVHWGYPVGDIQNLAPANSSNLYYSSGGVSDPAVQHLFGALSSTFTYDAVVLDHSSYVANTSCSAEGILVTFTSTEAYSFASDSWTAASSGFVLVTYTDGCHGTSNQQRTFWLIKSLEHLPDSLSIIIEVETEVAIEHALNDVDFQWGTYYPPGSNSAGSTPSSGSSSATRPQTTSNGAPSPSNSSTGSTSGSVCGNAPSSVIDGLPAANCGDAAFDTKLDTAIGFLQFDLDDAIDWVSEKATAVADTVVDTATQAYQAAQDLANEAAAKAAQLAKDLTELDPSISASTDFNYGPDANADSPWGKAAGCLV
ncbi:hypothetical protein KCU67_g859, partial [Aureobasidium melanogenum]